MKKFLSTVLVMVMVIMSLSIVANATTTSTMADDVYAKLSKYGMTATDKVKLERYLSDNTLTQTQVDSIMSKVDQAVALMGETTNVKDLTPDVREQLKALAVSAGNDANVKVVFGTNSVEIYDNNGKLLEKATYSDGKLVYTGNNVNVVLCVSILAVIALAVGVIKFAKTK